VSPIAFVVRAARSSPRRPLRRPTRRLFHIGDAVHDWRGLERGLSDPPILIDTNYDLPESERVVGALARYREAPELVFIPAHAQRGWRALFPDGPSSCVNSPSRAASA
jgi:hypothetical protein